MNDLLRWPIELYQGNPGVVSAAVALLVGYYGWLNRGFLAAMLPRVVQKSPTDLPDTVELVRRWQSLVEGCEQAKRAKAVGLLHELFPALSEEAKA